MNLMVYGKARGEHRRGHNLEFSRLRRDYVQEIALWTGKANGSIPNGDGTNGIVDMGSTMGKGSTMGMESWVWIKPWV